MNYLTEAMHLDNEFPFAIYHRTGFSEKEAKKEHIYMHNCLEINFALTEGGTYFIGEKNYPIHKNDIFIINSFEYHYAINKTGNVKLMVIAFDPELVWSNEQMDFQYIKTFYECKAGYRLTAENFASQSITDIIYEMYHEWQNKSTGYCLVIKSLLLKLLTLLYRRYEEIEQLSENITSFENEYARIIDAVKYINENYKEQIMLSSLAEIVHMNPNYFSTYFKKVMNCTVSS